MTTDTLTSTTPSTTATSVEAGPGCRACPHAWDVHDVIGRRFCTATIAGNLARGCACRPG
jgi:hypothetical protein